MRTIPNAFTSLLLRGGVGLLLILALTTTSCDLFRKAETTKVPKKDKPKEDPNAVPTRPVGTVLVDTIRWRSDPSAKPPITTSLPPANGGVATNPTDPNTGGTKPVDNSKNMYRVAMLLPFYTNEFNETDGNPAKSQFALDFYAGAKLALDSLSRSNFNLTFNVVDAKGDINTQLSSYEVSKADMVIGPIDRESVMAAVPFSTRNNVTMVSPFFPMGDIEGVNPRYIQVKPSLRTHCMNIVKHIRTNFNPGQVVLAARSRDNETNRFSFFQEANQSFGGVKFTEWRIDDESNFNIEAYIERNGTTTFVIPSWNEAFVTSFLRKVNASPRRNQVVVYGMPQWMDFNKSLYPIYDALKVRITSSTYIDNNAPEVQSFRNRFMNRFKKLPNSDAYLGYDVTLYFGQMLALYGSNFPSSLAQVPQNTLHTRFTYNPIYAKSTTGSDLSTNIAKYENTHVNMLRFQGNGFIIEQ
jgi:hypothetical protein